MTTRATLATTEHATFTTARPTIPPPFSMTRTIKAGVRRLSNVRVLHENPREAYLQALLARGDRRVGDLVERGAALDGDWRTALREWEGDANFYTHRERPPDELFPWDHLEVGVKKSGLIREHQRAGLSPAPAEA